MCVFVVRGGGGGGGGGEWRAIVKKRQPGTLCVIGARPHLFKIVGLEGGGEGAAKNVLIHSCDSSKKFQSENIFWNRVSTSTPGVERRCSTIVVSPPHAAMCNGVPPYWKGYNSSINMVGTTMYKPTHIILNVHINTRSGNETFHTSKFTARCSKV